MFRQEVEVSSAVMGVEGDGARLLRIDLASRTASEEAVPSQILRQHIGGAGLGVRHIADEAPPSADQLGPDNKLVIAVGPFTGISILAPAAWQWWSTLPGDQVRFVDGADV